jgi:branched-chain amino acid transport system substrate-binding protein
VKGDLSNGQKAYRARCRRRTSRARPATVRIDENRNGVGTTYITEVTKAPTARSTTRS